MSLLPVLGSIGAVGEGAHDVTGLLLALLVIFSAAQVGAELFERVRQPAVVGQILAGVIVGPHVLGWVHPNDITFALSELGVVFLLFLVGLETKPCDLLRVGRDASLVAVGGVVLPFVLGYGLMLLLGIGQVTALFVGAALVATSVGITARVLAREGVLELRTSRIILGAAVIDDVLGLLVLSVVSGFAVGGSIHYGQILLTIAYAVGFVLLMTLWGGRIIRVAAPALARLRIGHSLYLVAIGFCLLMSVLAGKLGVAAIVGAFLAGVAFAEVSEETGLHRWFEGLSEFFVPFFLVGIGMQLSLSSLGRGSVLALCLGVTLLAVVGKVVGCGAVLWRQSRREALQVGVGMVPRGEVGVVVAQLGLRLGVFSDDLFAVVIFVSVATTMMAPPLLARLYAGERSER